MTRAMCGAHHPRLTLRFSFLVRLVTRWAVECTYWPLPGSLFAFYWGTAADYPCLWACTWGATAIRCLGAWQGHRSRRVSWLFPCRWFFNRVVLRIRPCVCRYGCTWGFYYGWKPWLILPCWIRWWGWVFRGLTGVLSFCWRKTLGLINLFFIIVQCPILLIFELIIYSSLVNRLLNLINFMYFFVSLLLFLRVIRINKDELAKLRKRMKTAFFLIVSLFVMTLSETSKMQITKQIQA